MSELEGQVPTAEETQEVSPQPSAAEAAAPAAQEAEEERYDAAYVRKLRTEAAEYRRKLRELEAELRRRQEQELSEVERLRIRVEEAERAKLELERRLQEVALRSAVVERASQFGIIDPDAAYRLLDLARVEFDDDGRPTNLDTLLRELVRKRPYLAGQGASGVTATNPSRTTLSLEEALRTGDLEAINRAFEAVLRAQHKG